MSKVYALPFSGKGVGLTFQWERCWSYLSMRKVLDLPFIQFALTCSELLVLSFSGKEVGLIFQWQTCWSNFSVSKLLALPLISCRSHISVSKFFAFLSLRKVLVCSFTEKGVDFTFYWESDWLYLTFQFALFFSE